MVTPLLSSGRKLCLLTSDFRPNVVSPWTSLVRLRKPNSRSDLKVEQSERTQLFLLLSLSLTHFTCSQQGLSLEKMCDEKAAFNRGESKEEVANDLIWGLFDRDCILTDPSDQPENNALTILKYLLPLHDLDVSAMQIGFTYFILKDLRDMKLESRIGQAAFNVSESVVSKMHTTWINILHIILISYTLNVHAVVEESTFASKLSTKT